MKFLKGLALSVMSFLLFLSLSLFGLAFALNSTLLKADFVAGEVDKLDVAGLAKDIIEQQVQFPAEWQAVKPAIYTIIAAEEPWLKQQARAAINSGYDYFLSKSDHLRLSIPLEELKTRIKDKVKPVLKQFFLQSLPAQLAGATQAQIDQYYEQYFNQYWQQFDSQIPSNLDISESMLPPDTLRQLGEVRQYISYYQLGYKLLIAFMLLLVMGIVLINPHLKGATRELGTVLLSYGAFEYAGIFLAKYFLPGFLSAPAGIPPTLWTWLNGLINDVMSPLGVFSLGCVAGGVVLLVVSFVVKSPAAEP